MRSTFKLITLTVGLALLAACSKPAPQASSFGSDSITQAYNTAGVMNYKPYTRTIFSSTDF